MSYQKDISITQWLSDEKKYKQNDLFPYGNFYRVKCKYYPERFYHNFLIHVNNKILAELIQSIQSANMLKETKLAIEELEKLQNVTLVKALRQQLNSYLQQTRDRRIYLIEEKTNCHVVLRDLDPILHRGLVCHEMYICAPSIKQINIALILLKEKLTIFDKNCFYLHEKLTDGEVEICDIFCSNNYETTTTTTTAATRRMKEAEFVVNNKKQLNIIGAREVSPAFSDSTTFVPNWVFKKPKATVDALLVSNANNGDDNQHQLTNNFSAYLDCETKSNRTETNCNTTNNAGGGGEAVNRLNDEMKFKEFIGDVTVNLTTNNSIEVPWSDSSEDIYDFTSKTHSTLAATVTADAGDFKLFVNSQTLFGELHIPYQKKSARIFRTSHDGNLTSARLNRLCKKTRLKITEIRMVYTNNAEIFLHVSCHFASLADIPHVANNLTKLLQKSL